MASISFVISGPAGEAVSVTITQNSNQTFSFSFTQQGSVVGDILAVFFDIADQSLANDITGATNGVANGVFLGTPQVAIATSHVILEIPGFSATNMSGAGIDGFNVGIEAGTPAQAIHSFSFDLISTSPSLTLADFSQVAFGVRMVHVGPDGFSDKLVGTSGSSLTPPLISNTQPGQQVNDHATINPFANVQITDANPNQTETVIIGFNAANGTLTDAAGHPVSSVSGTPEQVTAALDALAFHPTLGLTATTDFTITVTDTAQQSASNANTSVIAIPLSIAGTVGGQPSAPIITPFLGASITDASNQTETVTITGFNGHSASPLNDLLIDPSGTADHGHFIKGGAYVFTGSAAAVTADLQALQLLPSGHGIQLTISVTDAAGATATDSNTSILGISDAHHHV